MDIQNFKFLNLNMTQEEKQLLLIDLSARLFYGVIVYSKGEPHIQQLVGYIPDIIHYDIKPYLRSLSNMTEEEKKSEPCGTSLDGYMYSDEAATYVDWLNAHHFDYRGLIEKGLAIEAPDGMYKIE
jgi:hypothetical protein